MCKFDIRSAMEKIKNFCKIYLNPCVTSSCYGFVLQLHYLWTAIIMFVGFLVAVCSWTSREVISCTSRFNSETQVRLDFLNVCLSYSFVEEEDGTRRYLLFYRWVPWMLLLVTCLYIIPRLVVRKFNNPQVQKLLESAQGKARSYDKKEGEELVEETAQYFLCNLNTHNGLYWKVLTANVVALVVDIVVVAILHVHLEGRFVSYGANALPAEKDANTFIDHMSQAFPPFANCALNGTHQLVNRRTETFGCHLTLMELYEKLFLVLWLWLVALLVVTSGYILCLAAWLIPALRALLLRPAKPFGEDEDAGMIATKVLRKCYVGDAYLLFAIKRRISHAHFYNLLKTMGDPAFWQKSHEMA